MELFDIDVVNNRVIINSMETRPMIAEPGETPGTLDIWCGTQGPVGLPSRWRMRLAWTVRRSHPHR